MARRLSAALAAGRRRLWVTAPRLLHDELEGAVRAALGDGAVIVRDPQLRPSDEVDALAAGMDSTLVVLAPARAARGASALLAAIERDGDLLEQDPGADEAELRRWVSDRLGCDLPTVDRVLARCGDRAHLVSVLVADLVTAELEDPGGAAAEIEGGVGTEIRTLFRGLIRRLPAPVLAGLEAASVDPSQPLDGESLESLDDEGVLDANGRLAAIVADAVLAELPLPTRSHLAGRLIERHRDGSLDAVAAATAVERAGVSLEGESELFASAAVAVADRDPATALRWLDVGAPVDAEEVRLRALAACGRMSEAIQRAGAAIDGGDEGVVARLVTGAGLAHAARLSSSADAYEAVTEPPYVAALGVIPRAVLAQSVAPTSGGASIAALAVGSFAAAAVDAIQDPEQALPLLVEAAENASDADILLWPDAPPVTAAVVASLLGDHGHAEDLVTRARAEELGGAAFRSRLAAIDGWVALRSGRWADADTAVVELSDADLSLRERLLHAGLRVALSHRGGDTSALEAAVADAVPVVRRHPVDLIAIFAHGEIAVGAARLGHIEQAGRLFDQLDGLVAGAAPLWRALAARYRLTGALCGDDLDRIADAAALLSDCADERSLDESVAEIATAPAAAGDSVDSTCRELLAAGQVLEAALLAGAVALSAPDEAAAKAPLRLARELRGRLPRGIADDASGVGALSDREMEVARELVDGFTYKEIGARLFISPKTVEHHVAHIRTKLGAGSRAEMLSALRASLG